MKQFSLKSTLLLGILSLQFGAFSQETEKVIKQKQIDPITYKSVPGPDGIIRCHTMHMDSVRRANNPGLPTLAQEEAMLQLEIAKFKASQGATNGKKVQYTIPIIFHIFTDGAGSENISAAKVQAQVDQLNIDYADQAGSPFAVSADTEIEFCLALVDNNGTPLAEPGINRITQYGQGPFSSNDFDNSMKAATQWDPNKYFNVWVANLSGGLLGYAQFPNNSGLAGMNANNGAANTDGCVIIYSSVGSVASPFSGGAPYNMGRTLTHEAGHWLGLRHIWGDGGCGASDFCNDTPDSDGSNFGCPNTTSCSSVDMVENYMDYTDDDCMNTFTADQKTRMQTVMAICPRRMQFITSTVCNSSSSVDDIGASNIVSPTGTYCGASFIPQVTVSNFGTNAVTSFTLSYNVDGGGTQTYAWTGNLGSGQSVTVTLPSMTSSAGAHTFNAFTSVPNGVTDTNAGNDGDANAFSINPTGVPITFVLETDCYGEETVYELYNASNTLLYTGGNTNVTVPVTATQNTATSDPGAYPSESTITEVWCLAEGCYDFYIHDAYGDGINGTTVQGCNTDGDYTITDAQNAVLGSMQAPNGSFDFGETINFCVVPGGNSLGELTNADFMVYPNPSTGVFNVQMLEQLNAEFTVSVLDVTGRIVYQESRGENAFSIDLSNAASGSYTVAIQTLEHTMMKRVVVK